MPYGMSNKGLAGAVVVASVVLIGGTAASLAMTLTPDSKVWVEGTSTVRDWKCVATALESEIVPTSAETAGLPVERLVQSAQVAIEVAKLDCGNGTMDGHMRKALGAHDNPRLVFALTSYRISGSDATLVGTLTLAGRENLVEIAGTVTEVDDVIRVQAAHAIRMTEWGIKPPSLMLGTMKVRDEVKIHIDIAVHR